MFASTKLIAAFSVVAAAAAAVLAAPAVFDPSGAKIDIVYRPHLTSPVEGDSWPIGSQQTVTWDASDIPPEALYQTGVLLLGHLVDGSSNEHLDIGECPLSRTVGRVAYGDCAMMLQKTPLLRASRSRMAPST